MTRLAAFLLSVLAAPASAACLTAADLEAGVRVEFSNDDWTTLRSLGEGIVEFEEYYADAGFSSRYLGYLGLYILSGVERITAGPERPNQRTRRVYPLDPTELPVPEPDGEGWTGVVSQSFYDGTLPVTQDWTIDVRFLPVGPLALPGCTYEAVGVRVLQTYAPEDWSYEMLQLYLPALGSAFVIASRESGGAWSAADPTAIVPLR
jgi:hypothetical protein